MRSRLVLAVPVLCTLAACAMAGGERPGPGTVAETARQAADAGAAEPVSLSWRASREDGVFGYLVYRAEAREGPYVRINDEIIEATADGAETHLYELVDAEVEAGTTYHYYLDVVSTSGHKSRFSGVVSQTARPAVRPDPEPDEPD